MADINNAKAWRSLAIGYMILTLSGAIALFLLERKDTHRLRTAQMAECTRVNYLRRQDNANALVIYGALYAGLQRERQLYQAAPPNSRLRRTHYVAYRSYAKYSAGLRHTSLTDCNQAVDHAKQYVPPLPRPFRPSDLKEAP